MSNNVVGLLAVALLAGPMAAQTQMAELNYTNGIFSGNVTLNSPLPSADGTYTVSPYEFNFPTIGDGVGYNYYPDTAPYYTLGGRAQVGTATFSFTTAGGIIDAWDIQIGNETIGTNSPWIISASITSNGDTFTQQQQGGICPYQPDTCHPWTVTSTTIGS